MRPGRRFLALNRTHAAILTQPIGKTFVFGLAELQIPAWYVFPFRVAARGAEGVGRVERTRLCAGTS